MTISLLRLILDGTRNKGQLEQDEEFLEAAIEVANEGSTTFKVGAVIVQGKKIIGSGYRIRESLPGDRLDIRHAEFNALQIAGTRAQGATLYSTLEPCCCRGDYSDLVPYLPCADLIVNSGISRVVAGVLDDTDDRINGKGMQRLERNGVVATVYQGSLTPTLKELIRRF